MKLSRASTYALYGVGYLAEQASGRFVPLSETHRRRSVPDKHLAKIFNALVRAGILRSERGSKGGVSLARPADETTLLQVIEAVEGPEKGPSCFIHQDPCAVLEQCPIHRFLFDARSRMMDAFRWAKVSDLVDRSGGRFRAPSESGGGLG